MSSPAEKLRKMNEKLGMPTLKDGLGNNQWIMYGANAQCPNCDHSFPLRLELHTLMIRVRSPMAGTKGIIEK